MPPPFTCVFCEEKFESKEYLHEHFRLHGAECHKKKNPSYVPKGLKSSKDASKVFIKCDWCEQKFDSSTKAIAHKYRKHRDVRFNSFCSWCGKQFPVMQMYDAHVETHFNETIPTKTIPCFECDTVFYSDTALKYHCSSFHRNSFSLQFVEIPPPSKKIYVNGHGDVQSVYYCHLCGNEYVVKYNLQQHLKKVHSGAANTNNQDLIKCTTCDAIFYNKKAYDVHNNYHTKGDLYVVSEAMRQQVITKVDQDFDFRRVRAMNPFPQYKTRTNNAALKNLLRKQNELSMGIGSFESFSPPPSDADSDDESSSNNQETSSNAISLDEFMDMNKDIFGDVNDLAMTETTPKEILKQEKPQPLPVESKSGCSGTSASNNFPPKVTSHLPTLTMLTKEQLLKLKSTGLLRPVRKPTNLSSTIINKIATKNSGNLTTTGNKVKIIHVSKNPNLESISLQPKINFKPQTAVKSEMQPAVINTQADRKKHTLPTYKACENDALAVENVNCRIPTVSNMSLKLTEEYDEDMKQILEILKNEIKSDGIIECDFCPMKFKISSEAISHVQKVHHNISPRNFCPWCGKLFSMKHLLDVHKAMHPKTANKPETIYCNCCKAFFHNAKVLNNHISIYHVENVKSYITGGILPCKKLSIDFLGEIHPVYNCQFCGCESYSKQTLQEHLQDSHAEERTQVPKNIIKCDKCGATLYNTIAYEKHLTFHTSDGQIFIDNEMRNNRNQLLMKIDQDDTGKFPAENSLEASQRELRKRTQYLDSIDLISADAPMQKKPAECAHPFLPDESIKAMSAEALVAKRKKC